MLHVTDTENDLDMTARYAMGQEVVITGFQGYRKGVVTGIAVLTNDKGTVILYTVELYAGRKGGSIIKRCPERNVYGSVKEALNALSEQEERQESHE